MAGGKAKKSRSSASEESGSNQPGYNQLLQSIERLHEVQEQLDKLAEEETEKVAEVEQFYSEAKKPVYARRNGVIASIQDFWLTIFLSHPALGEIINEDDQEILSYLDSLVVEDFHDLGTGYCIKLNFHPNPFFDNVQLTKTVKILGEGSLRTTGTIINWKHGKDPANGNTEDKDGNKRMLPKESFFNWFNSPKPGESVEVAYDGIAEIIKEELWPNPMKYLKDFVSENEIDEEEEDDDAGGDNDESESEDDDDSSNAGGSDEDADRNNDDGGKKDVEGNNDGGSKENDG